MSTDMTTDSRPPDWAVARAFLLVYEASKADRRFSMMAHQIQPILLTAQGIAAKQREIAEEAEGD